MNSFVVLVLLRLVVFVVLPVGLLVLLIGPRRVQHGLFGFWGWLWTNQPDPERILTEVVLRHQGHVAELARALSQAEAVEAGITANRRKCADNVAHLEDEARAQVTRGDDLGARATLAQLNMERLAVVSFAQQQERQRERVHEARKRLYLAELQLRQYEVGRSLLLSKLAEARSVEQQYALANNFDPFNAVANWRQAEGLVEERAHDAHAVAHAVEVAVDPDPAAVEAELARLKAEVHPPSASNGKGRSHPEK